MCKSALSLSHILRAIPSKGGYITLCSRVQLETWKQRLQALGSPSMCGRDLLRPNLAASTLRCMIRLATCTGQPIYKILDRAQQTQSSPQVGGDRVNGGIN